jgi:hypothetical protein
MAGATVAADEQIRLTAYSWDYAGGLRRWRARGVGVIATADW